MTVTSRLANRERPDTSRFELTDNGFFFEWRTECDAPDCSMREVAYDQAEAEWIERTHPCPMKYDPPRRYSYLSIAEFYWIELDGVVDEIKAWQGGEDDHQLLIYRGRAGGLAFAIVHACQPYYADEKAVAKESLKRWRIRNGQVDWEPTPGFKYDPPVPGLAPVQQYRGPDSATPTFNKTKIDKAISTLGTKKVGDIKRALEQGMFPARDLARVYSVDVAVIEAIEKS